MNILICHLVKKLIKVSYETITGNKLEFPALSVGSIVVIGDKNCVSLERTNSVMLIQAQRESETVADSLSFGHKPAPVHHKNRL